MPLVSKVILFLLILNSFWGLAQDEDVVYFTQVSHSIFPEKAESSFDHFIKKEKEPKQSDSIPQKTDFETRYWIRLDFGPKASQMAQDTTLFLKFNYFDLGKLFFSKEGTVNYKNIGRFNTNSKSKKIKSSNYHAFVSFRPKDFIEGRYLYLNVQRTTFKEDLQNWEFSYSGISPNHLNIAENKTNRTLYGVFAGICFIMLLSALSLFAFKRNTEFLCYSLYLIVLFVYIAGRHFGVYQTILDSDLLEFWVSESFIFLANMAYCLFLIAYLETRKNYPIIHLICITGFITNVIVLIVTAICFANGLTYALMYIVENSIVILNVFGLLGAIYLIFVRKNKLVYFIASATIVLCLGGLAKIYLAKPEDGLFLDSMNYMMVGGSIEIIIFAFGLNYKANMELHENYRLKQESLINKIKALRAQINPHFIFNALGSIQHLIFEKKNTKALNYLTKFSRLMRNVLESSIKNSIPLVDEINMIKDYLELESLRFNNAFSYKIEVDENIDEHELEMPSMILQPFIENALIHGLLPKKEGDKELNVRFKMKEEQFLCIIDDTGVGRQSAKQRLHIYQNEKKSRGLEVTRQRLTSLGVMDDPIQIIDKLDDMNRPLGTKVIIKIPL